MSDAATASRHRGRGVNLGFLIAGGVLVTATVVLVILLGGWGRTGVSGNMSGPFAQGPPDKKASTSEDPRSKATWAYWNALVATNTKARMREKEFEERFERMLKNEPKGPQEAAAAMRDVIPVLKSISDSYEDVLREITRLSVVNVEPEAPEIGRRYFDGLRRDVSLCGDLTNWLGSMASFLERHSTTSDQIYRFLVGNQELNEEQARLKSQYEDMERNLKSSNKEYEVLWSEAERVRISLSQKHGRDFPAFVR
jgi:hypothetical protein